MLTRYTVLESGQNSSTLVFGCDGKWITLDLISEVEDYKDSKLCYNLGKRYLTLIKMTGAKYANFIIRSTSMRMEDHIRFTAEAPSTMVMAPGDYYFEIASIQSEV